MTKCDCGGEDGLKGYLRGSPMGPLGPVHLDGDHLPLHSQGSSSKLISSGISLL